MVNTETQNDHLILRQLISDRIAQTAEGRISFAEYMELVLYHPQHGYYGSGAVNMGAKGDFVTSPHLSADFGELLAEQFVLMWENLGKPNPFTLVEMGAGQGILAADILTYIKVNYPHFLAVLEYVIVEKAPGLIDQQQKILRNWVDKWGKMHWKTWAEIPQNSIIGCCFSNELVDALPVHQFVIKTGKLQEIYVTKLETENRFSEVIGEASTPRLAKYLELIEIDPYNYEDGYRSEINLAALDWLEIVANRLQKGYVLTIDYGYEAKRYYNPQRNQGTLQCYYRHRHHHNPYLYIGNQDITAHVDFTALERQGEILGLEKVDFTKQGLFLMALGMGKRLTSLAESNENIQEILRRRDALHQLIDPMGLGGFGVLIQRKREPGLGDF